MAHIPGAGGHATGIQGQNLQINIVGCRNLTDKEWFSRQDPYVTIEYANNRFRTRTDTDGGKNPTFNEKFTIPLIEGLREVNVTVWNSNTVSLDDYIGSARVLLEKVLSTGYDDTSWPLKSKHGKTSGEVNLILHYANSANSKIGKAEKLHGAAAGYPPGGYPAHGSPAGYPPSGYPPAGYAPAAAAHGAPAGYPPPPHGAPSGYPPPPHGAPSGYSPAHGAPSGYPPSHGAPPSYAAAPGGYPPAQPYPGGYPPAGGYPPSASAYPSHSSHGAPYPAPGYPPAPGHAPSGHYPAPGGYPGAPPVYGVPPGMHKAGKAGKVHVGSSGHYKHGKHKKYKGSKFFGKKFKGWKGKGWKGKGWKGWKK